MLTLCMAYCHSLKLKDRGPFLGGGNTTDEVSEEVPLDFRPQREK
jgi:hypothetical protein